MQELHGCFATSLLSTKTGACPTLNPVVDGCYTTTVDALVREGQQMADTSVTIETSSLFVFVCLSYKLKTVSNNLNILSDNLVTVCN
jgi:hypothetical protein